MSRIFIITNLLILHTVSLLSQNEITGVVTDAVSGEPIEAAHVFIAHSEMGTLTDVNGLFQLPGLPVGQLELIVSFIGYQPENMIVQMTGNSSRALTIKLESVETVLSAVEVKGKKTKNRKRNLKAFEKAILGSTPNASKCEIVNPEVILLIKKDNELVATATDLIKIDNQATGYRMFFLLENFNKKGSEVNYSGKPLFIALDPENEKQQLKWEKNREKAYKGSKRHFLSSLARGESKKEGFRVYNAYQIADGSLKQGYPVNLKKLVTPTFNKDQFKLSFSQFLKVVYLNEEDRITIKTNDGLGKGASGLGRPAEKDLIQQSARDLKPQNNPQVSYLFSKKSSILFDRRGYLLESNMLLEYNYWNFEGLADMLPLNYNSAKAPVSQTTPPGKKGFILTDLLIPNKEIFDGGPPKDGIPSIDNPQFIKAEKAQFLKGNDRIIGLVIDGQARAYPIQILDFHEIVNDKIGHLYLSVTWCPLCGSGVVFSHGSKKRSFGVSGLLYNSDVLLYDRETESLWSQIMGQAISGSLSGEQLSLFPSVITTWSLWKEKYPSTLVLSRETGYSRNYDQKAYVQYLNSDQLMFPVANTSDQLPNKERVLGVQIGEKYKAYPFSVLKQKTTPFYDTFNGKKLRIYFDAKSEFVSVETAGGTAVKHFTLFWFAWYGFHPETEVFD